MIKVYIQLTFFMLLFSLLIPLFIRTNLEKDEYVVDRDAIDQKSGPYKIKSIEVFETSKGQFRIEIAVYSTGILKKDKRFIFLSNLHLFHVPNTNAVNPWIDNHPFSENIFRDYYINKYKSITLDGFGYTEIE